MLAGEHGEPLGHRYGLLVGLAGVTDDGHRRGALQAMQGHPTRRPDLHIGDLVLPPVGPPRRCGWSSLLLTPVDWSDAIPRGAGVTGVRQCPICGMERSRTHTLRSAVWLG